MTHLGCPKYFELVIIIIIMIVVIMVIIKSPYLVETHYFPNLSITFQKIHQSSGLYISGLNHKVGVSWHSLVIVFFDCRGQV